MSNASPANSPAPTSTDPEEVLNLFCPVCDTGLNIRRKHVGVKGNCVQCKTAVTAKDVGGKIALVAANAPKPEPEPEAPTEPETTPEVPSQTADDARSPLGLGSIPPTKGDPAAAFDSPQSANSPRQEPGQPAAATTFSSPTEVPASPWGFPGRDEVGGESAGSPAGSPPAFPPEPPVAGASPSDATTPSEFSTFDNIDSGAATPQAEAQPEPQPDAASPFDSPSDNASSPFDTPPLPDRNLQPASADDQPEQAPDETPAAPAAPEPAEKSSKMEDSSFSLEKEVPIPSAGSALFGGQGGTAGSDDANSGEINASWGAKVPTPGHASISPFDKSNSSAGFAESLFHDKAVEQSATEKIEPKSPFTEPADPGLGGGALFASPASSSTPTKSEAKEEVVLDGDGRPMKPMSDEEKDNFAKEMMQVGSYHKRSPWVVRIVKFLITLCVLGGIGYAGYIFMPDEKVKEWKQKTLDWLEPGSVLLDFLPVEIVENEDGEKEMKVKAVESLNDFSDEMDAYLDASEENLRETGADVPEREKTEKMEGPDIPKLPFELPKVDRGGGESTDAPKE